MNPTTWDDLIGSVRDGIAELESRKQSLLDRVAKIDKAIEERRRILSDFEEAKAQGWEDPSPRMLPSRESE